MEVYNTMTRSKEAFEKENKRIKLFVCGPTVYDDAHIGHGRTYVSFDMIKRYFEFIGFSVYYIENITDIDDKIINRAKERGIYHTDLARIYEDKFKEDMAELGVNGVNLYARATEHLGEIYDQIERLMEKGYAYETDTGIYFEVAKFPEFGKLSNRKLEDLTVSRVSDKTKKHPHDFALWKKTEEKPYYPSKWGNGRPGWHIEDTAITEEYFGPQYDIHGGGLDLIFPHHEAEIAQMEAVSGKVPLVRFWMHTGFLNVDGVKMSKSLGNFITIRDLLKNWSGTEFRLFVLSTHYRSPIDFSKKSLHQASKNLERLNKTVENIIEALSLFNIDGEEFLVEACENINSSEIEINTKIEELNKLKLAKEEFKSSMDDDFNTPEALASILSFTKVINQLRNNIINNELSINKEDTIIFLKESLLLLKDFDTIFNVKLFEASKNDTDISKELIDIINDTRDKLRKNKNYELSDEIRDKLESIGLNIEDT
ncbi:MAG: cysteine--tRNA ligase [Methanobacteriaceae archaeon]